MASLNSSASAAEFKSQASDWWSELTDSVFDQFGEQPADDKYRILEGLGVADAAYVNVCAQWMKEPQIVSYIDERGYQDYYLEEIYDPAYQVTVTRFPVSDEPDRIEYQYDYELVNIGGGDSFGRFGSADPEEYVDLIQEQLTDAIDRINTQLMATGWEEDNITEVS